MKITLLRNAIVLVAFPRGKPREHCGGLSPMLTLSQTVLKLVTSHADGLPWNLAKCYHVHIRYKKKILFFFLNLMYTFP